MTSAPTGDTSEPTADEVQFLPDALPPEAPPEAPLKASPFLTLSRACAVAVVALGALVLLGWALDVEVLKSLLHPGRIAMNPMTAVCFILCGSSLLAARPQCGPDAVAAGRDSSSAAGAAAGAAVRTALPGTLREVCRSRLLARCLAGAVVLLALLKMASFFPFVGHSWAPPVDRILFAGRLETNVMAPNTTINFLLVGLALLLLDVETRRRLHPSTPLTLAACCIALLAVTGYVYQVLSFYKVQGYIPMALNTALTFMALCVGTLSARVHRQPVAMIRSNTAGGIMVRRLLPWAVILPLAVGWVRLYGQRVGLYGTEFGVTIMSLANVVIFVSLIWWNARVLHRLDYRRRRTEQILREAEAVYHSLVETLPQNIYRKDLRGRFTFGNNKFCTTMGRPLSHIVGKTDLDFFPPESAQKYQADDRQVLETGQTLDKVEQHVTPAGRRLYVQVMKTPVRAPDGRITGTQGIFWDVTDRVTAEQELAAKNRQLEEAHRSEHAAHEALKAAQGQMIQSEKLASLGQMVAGVAHEINNPLAFVANNIAVLQRDVAALGKLVGMYQGADAAIERHDAERAAQIRQFAQRLDVTYTLGNLDGLLTRSRDGMRRIQEIVKDLKEFARLDRGDVQEADLNAGVQSTLNIITGHAKKKQVRLEPELAPLPPVECQPAKINQVVMNLLTNAIDASKENGRVVVRTRALSAGAGTSGGGNGDGEVQIEVQDEGTGIPPDVRQRIFDPFFTTKPLGKGMGLGLSISYGIVRDHGGRIEVDSEVGKGTTFRVTLPTRMQPQPQREAQPQPAAKDGNETGRPS